MGTGDDRQGIILKAFAISHSTFSISTESKSVDSAIGKTSDNENITTLQNIVSALPVQ
jgi:hypothetical protein